MRFGAPVFRYKNAAEWAKRHEEKGYTAAYWPLGVNAGGSEEREYVKAAEDAGLVIAEVGIWNNMLDSDSDKRRANFEYALRRFETAERVGARCCVNVSGSRGSFWDGPHRLNLTKETYDMVVEQAQRLIDTVRPTRTTYTLEPMPWMYPHDETDLINMIRDIDRPAFAAHVDMVNLINSYDKYIANGELTERYFKELGPYIRSVHVKDTRVLDDQLTLHIAEAPVGEGEFEFEPLLRNCAALDEDLPMMLEHLEAEADYDRAGANFRRIAEELGYSFR